MYEINSKTDWNDFSGEILAVEDWKPGVKRLHCRDLKRRRPVFWFMYCRDEHLPDEYYWPEVVLEDILDAEEVG